MSDLFCLVADKSMEAVIQALLGRSQALGIRPITLDTAVHVHRDSGCFGDGVELLQNSRANHLHGLLVLDHAWEGCPANTGDGLVDLIRQKINLAGLQAWADVVVIDPELEVWLFTESPHFARCLRWPPERGPIRDWLCEKGLWPENSVKPPDPKAAIERLLRETRTPKSSATYREIATLSSFRGCTDASFSRLRQILANWFPAA